MSAAELQIYDFRGNEIRIEEIDGVLWFVASDIGGVLGLSASSVRNITGKLPEEFKGVLSINTLGGPQKTTIISYEGVVLMLIRSRKPEAEPFQMWLATEVVPSIKRKGYYIAEPKTEMEIVAEVSAATTAVAKRMVAHERQLEDHEERISVMEETTEEGLKLLWDVERASEEPSAKTTRMKINTLIRAFCDARRLPHAQVWKRLYIEFRDRYHIDLWRRAENNKEKPLDVAERLGYIDELFAVASALFR